MTIIGDVIGEYENLKHLGSFVKNNRDFGIDLQHMIKFSWIKWREVSDVLCNEKILM